MPECVVCAWACFKGGEGCRDTRLGGGIIIKAFEYLGEKAFLNPKPLELSTKLIKYKVICLTELQYSKILYHTQIHT